ALAREPRAEPQDQQGHKRNQRHGVPGGKVDAKCGFRDAKTANQQSERHADQDRERIAQQERSQGFVKRRPKLSCGRQVPKGHRYSGWVRAEGWIDTAAKYFPQEMGYYARRKVDHPSRQCLEYSSINGRRG